MRILYQTIIDSGDPDKIERDGPIKCSSSDAWLGIGYYFWDSFIDLAHHWGKTHCNGNYVICKATENYSEEELYDLINNPEHIIQFRGITEALMAKYSKSKKQLTVPFIIEYLKSIGVFSYKAIRACGIGSFYAFTYNIVFSTGHKAFLESLPAWQICILEKQSVLSGSYKIVYPQHYIQEYVV